MTTTKYKSRGRRRIVPGKTQKQVRKDEAARRRAALAADTPHPCPNCSKPTPAHRKFCGDPCRKEFHRYGGISPRRLFPLIERELLAPMRKDIEQLRARVAELEQRSPQGKEA